ncbi:hypothetical protein TNCT_317551 [Trichonephila clavata]|uniref:Uncharacterized protein n=1 Tax=Trichonephila clavata TaxID=2740835 RepID=A0A8X6G2F8_TRICU|nr:hypothetical protein TNCT_317551 [Trichonephila clavata]
MYYSNLLQVYPFLPRSSRPCAELQREQPHGRVVDDQVSRGLRWWTPTEFHSGDVRCRSRGHAQQHDECHSGLHRVRPHSWNKLCDSGLRLQLQRQK